MAKEFDIHPVENNRLTNPAGHRYKAGGTSKDDEYATLNQLYYDISP